MSVVCYLQLVFVSTSSSSKVPEYFQLTLLTVALMLQCCVRPSVVCNVCIVTKRCVLPKNCMKKQIENGLLGMQWSRDR